MKTGREKVKVKYTPAYQAYHSAGDEAEPYCPKCEADLSYDEYNFCPWCGSELDWEPEPKSEKVIIDEFPFDTGRECPECGGCGSLEFDGWDVECPKCDKTNDVDSK